MTSSCTTGTFGYPVPGSPLPPVSLGAAKPSPSTTTPTTVAVPSTMPPPQTATATPAPSTTDQTPRRVATPTTFPGPADIQQMPASEAHDWRDLVSVYFKARDVDRVLDIIACESGGVWSAQSKIRAGNGMIAQGLMQHLDGYWPSRSKKANAAGYTNHGDIWSPIDQIVVSAWLAYNTPQGFSHWVCDKGGT